MMEKKLTNQDLLRISKCPGCGAQHNAGKSLPCQKYLGNICLLFPDDYKLMVCENCKILYKNYLTTPQFEKEIQTFYYNTGGEFKRWDVPDPKGYIYILNLINTLLGNNDCKTPVDLLDVGIGNGDFLKLAKAESRFRVSGMEINPVYNFSELIDGKFLNNSIEDDLDNSYQNSFDIITLFDVMEHVVNPTKVGNNINGLLKKDGLLVIETGNTDFWFPKYISKTNWWYTQILEHKILWNKKSIVRWLEQNNFKILHFEVKRHKGGNKFSWKPLLTYPLYKLCKPIYRGVVRLMGKKPTVPVKYRFRGMDHLLVIAQKIR